MINLKHSTNAIQPNIEGHDCLIHLVHAGVSHDFVSFLPRNQEVASVFFFVFLYKILMTINY